MTTEKIREEIERLKTLFELRKNLSIELGQSKDFEMSRIKLRLAKEEMLKSTYTIGKLLKELEKKA